MKTKEGVSLYYITTPFLLEPNKESLPVRLQVLSLLSLLTVDFVVKSYLTPTPSIVYNLFILICLIDLFIVN